MNEPKISKGMFTVFFVDSSCSEDAPENHLMIDRVRRTHSLDLARNAAAREVSNAFNLNITLRIPHTFPDIFSKVLIRQTCSTVKSFLCW